MFKTKVEYLFLSGKYKELQSLVISNKKEYYKLVNDSKWNSFLLLLVFKETKKSLHMTHKRRLKAFKRLIGIYDLYRHTKVAVHPSELDSIISVAYGHQEKLKDLSHSIQSRCALDDELNKYDREVLGEYTYLLYLITTNMGAYIQYSKRKK